MPPRFLLMLAAFPTLALAGCSSRSFNDSNGLHSVLLLELADTQTTHPSAASAALALGAPVTLRVVSGAGTESCIPNLRGGGDVCTSKSRAVVSVLSVTCDAGACRGPQDGVVPTGTGAAAAQAAVDATDRAAHFAVEGLRPGATVLSVRVALDDGSAVEDSFPVRFVAAERLKVGCPVGDSFQPCKPAAGAPPFPMVAQTQGTLPDGTTVSLYGDMAFSVDGAAIQLPDPAAYSEEPPTLTTIAAGQTGWIFFVQPAAVGSSSVVVNAGGLSQSLLVDVTASR